jgi:hypothetical protein
MVDDRFEQLNAGVAGSMEQHSVPGLAVGMSFRLDRSASRPFGQMLQKRVASGSEGGAGSLSAFVLRR